MIEVLSENNDANYHASKTTNGIMYLWTGTYFYITIAYFGNVGLQLSRDQKVGEDGKELVE